MIQYIPRKLITICPSPSIHPCKIIHIQITQLQLQYRFFMYIIIYRAILAIYITMQKPAGRVVIILLLFLILVPDGVSSSNGEIVMNGSDEKMKMKMNTNTMSSVTTVQRFKEGPKFYNSPECASTPTTVCSPSNDVVHIAMTLDTTYLRGSMAAILSVLQHSSCPENIFFHFVSSSHAHILRAAVSAAFPFLSFQLYYFPPSTVSSLISTSVRPALDCPLNYARMYLPHLLPTCVRRVVYLDSDVIVVDDIARVASTPNEEEWVVAAPEYCNANFSSYFTRAFWSSAWMSSNFAAAKRRPCYFNTGVMVMDMVRWRAGDYTAKMEEWMRVQRRMRIYELGSLPPFLLVFGGSIGRLDQRWNQHGLGGDNWAGLCRDLHPGPVSLLHWSGKGKPWVRLDANRPCPLDALWAPYDLFISSTNTTSAHPHPFPNFD